MAKVDLLQLRTSYCALCGRSEADNAQIIPPQLSALQQQRFREIAECLGKEEEGHAAIKTI